MTLNTLKYLINHILKYHSQDGCLATPISEYGRRTVYKVMELEQITNSRQTVSLYHLCSLMLILDTLQKSLRRTMKNIVLLLF